MAAARNYSGASVIQVHYDSGRKNVRMGNGPGAISRVLADSSAIAFETITVEERPFELGTATRIWPAVSSAVKAAAAQNRFPVLLAGGCFNSLAALSAIGSDSVGLIWFDAHGDFNTPETTPSGYFDGMTLAAITGRCWRNLTASVPGFRAMPEENVLLIGARDIDPEEQAALEASHIGWLRPGALRENGVGQSLKALVARLPETVYIHLDLDVLDVSQAHVNEYSCPGGLMLSEVLEIIDLIGHNRAIVGAAITAYDPSVDHDSRALNAGVAAAKELLAAACIDIS